MAAALAALLLAEALELSRNTERSEGCGARES